MAFNRLARPRIAGSHGAWVLFAGKPWRGDAAYAPDNRRGVRSSEPGSDCKLYRCNDVLGIQFRAERGGAARVYSTDAELSLGGGRSGTRRPSCAYQFCSRGQAEKAQTLRRFRPAWPGFCGRNHHGKARNFAAFPLRNQLPNSIAPRPPTRRRCSP